MTHPKPTGPLVVALVSGGLDSMVAGAMMRARGHRLCALSMDYHQRHHVELAAARRVASALGVERHVVLPLDLSLFGGSALTADIDVPKQGEGEGIPITYVPARNTIFLSLALGWAEAIGARDMCIGVNAVDYSGYPDCRPEFIAAFEQLAELATKAGVEGQAFRVHAPLEAMTKADIIREGMALGLDLGISWSCYDPSVEGVHCGRCDSCRIRARGFVEAGVPDPTLYAN
ncbi:MAG TPA: 7-cyano-7-deazaguanine synthase QueC [Sphingomonas sp.]|jgi:7-cyano-7-deazaguanine synthase|nr:7-cyano-7-deazaguanine synthase QueC [Sphingomonas sp.]